MAEMLSTEEKKIATAYRQLFGENYVPSLEHKTDNHVKAQKMCYLLSRINCDVVDVGFVWNTYGPFSVRLQDLLKRLDEKEAALCRFYENYDPKSILDDDVLEGVEKLKNKLEVKENAEDSRRWIELLASLSFLAHSELPTSDFTCIQTTLKRRKPAFSSDWENTKAWKLLETIGVAH